jgi:hypothetical protein
MNLPKKWTVLIPKKYWSPFPNDIFERWLKNLKESHASALYARLHDRAYHRSPPVIKGTVEDFAEWMQLDLVSVKACAEELQETKLIRLRRTFGGSRKQKKSKKHRRPHWKVPVASLELEDGRWFPVPRFIVRKYIPAYPNAILLVLLLMHHNYHHEDYVFPGIQRLSYLLGWRSIRVKEIETMSNGKKWEALKTGLPRPLTLKLGRQGYKWLTHYRVRAIRYKIGGDGSRTVRMTKRFAEMFLP